uniref:Piezo-type mechanosensitive ion channel component n=1 Tax=Esox lucius TaxID=8010 RepID=A0A6Q2X453_ESOLU
MASEMICGLIFRLLLPICLATACLFRYNGLSFVYLIYLLLIPLFAEPTSTTMQGHTGHLLLSLCITSFSFLLFHIIYQITINSILAWNNIKPDFNCTLWEKSIRQIGFESVIGADAGNGIRVFLPDVGMFLAGLGCWLVCRSLVQKRPPEDMAQDNTDFEPEEEAGEEEEDEEMEEEEEEEGEMEVEESTKMKILRRVAGVASRVKEIIGNLITTAGKVVVTILLGLTGIMLPSLTSAVYFFVFLFLCTWWSFCRTFDTLIFSCMCVLMAIFSAGHLVVLYLYQFQFFQEVIPPEDHYISLFGISSIIQTNCSSTWRLIVNPTMAWHHFVNPIMLLLLYYTLATLIRLWLQEPVEVGTPLGPNPNSLPGTPLRPNPSSLPGTPLGPNSNPSVKSNGTSFDLISPLNVENGPVCLDLYSTPQYKMDQTNSIEKGEEEEQEEEEQEEEEQEEGRVNAAVTVFRFIMKQSYICALIAMMAWSITYVSWLTFVFLMWSCMLWMVRDRRRYTMLTSPFMVLYGNLLLVLQYIWSFELMQPVPGLFIKKTVLFRELGSKVLCLFSFWLLLRQTLMERQEKQREEAAVLTDVHVDLQPQRKEEEEEEEGEQDIMQVLGNMVMDILVKYWIYICGMMFFLVSFEGRMVMYKIIYMMLFLFCVALYQVHYEYWRRILKYFWMSVVVYTMMVLILVYTFQFDTSLPFWSKLTGMSKEKLKDLGLEQFSVSVLFTRIFIPTSFLLVCILHLHYFHDRFLQLTDLKAVAQKQDSTIYSHAKVNGRVYVIMNRWVPARSSPASMQQHPDTLHPSLLDLHPFSISPFSCLLLHLSTTPLHLSCVPLHLLSRLPDVLVCLVRSDLKNKWHLVVDRLTVLLLKFLEYFHKLQIFIWWLLEIHVIKIVSSYIILVSVKEVTLFNYVFLACWAFALPFRRFRPVASSICTVWTCVVIVCKMLYQLESINPPQKNCSMEVNYSEKQKQGELKNSLFIKQRINPSNWVGLEKFNPLLDYLTYNFLMLALLAFEVTIYRHQEFYRLRNKLTAPAARIIFHDITRQHLDHGILKCAKYFINYFFYKFGLETCFLLAVNVIGQRMDFYAMLHAFALITVMYRRRRKAIAEIWSKYCCFLACLLTWQYFICIGIPPAACREYPWRFPNWTMESNVIKWLYIPDFHMKPNPMFLIYDFMLLLCASMQRSIFDEENEAAVRLMAGDNVEICRDLDASSFSIHNPVPDFIHCRSYLDMLKVIVFSYLFWFVLTIIFITGTTRISIFCLGYLVGCFYFLLFGGQLLLKPTKTILHYWDFLIAYNVFVITMKNILSILACGYIRILMKDSCWLIQLLSLACTIKEYDDDKACDLPSDEAGIIWDSICFAFLLLQRRVFMSYYFLHVVADIRASEILASRGAELFQATIVKAVKARLEEERKSMEQLKRQMDRIKQRQEKFKRGKEKMLSLVQESIDGQKPIQLQEQEDDDDGTYTTFFPSVVRSGDYYLFETDSEEEEEEDVKSEDQEPPKKSAFQRAVGKFLSALIALPRSIFKLPKTILQYILRAAKFLYHAWITDSKTAMKERSKEKRKFWKRSFSLMWFTCFPRFPPDNILKRVFNIIKFTWVLFQTTVESFTKWMNNMCREHIDISTVLRIERCMLTREVKKGNVPSRESIHIYYQKQMRMATSCGSSLDRPHIACRPHYTCFFSHHFHFPYIPTSAYTEATMLFSRQGTLDDLDGMPSDIPIPKTSERPRPKLRKIYGLEASKSSDSSSSQVSSLASNCSILATQCITLYSRQGTNDTIEEVEDEQDQGEDRQRGPREPFPPEGPEGADGDRAGQLYTPDTDAPNTSDAELPPTYSKAVSFDRLEMSDDESDKYDKRMMVMTPDTSRSDYQDDPRLPSLTTELTASELLLNKMFYDEELERSDKFYNSQPLALQLLYALYNMLVAHSEMVCYLVIILNNMLSASCVTLILPILIFLWAMLSVPRPSKRFWMCAIVYTEVTIIIKYFFQFSFFPFNQNLEVSKTRPYHPPNIIGVEKKDGYVVYDLIQLLALFFHRSILKCHGLWDEDDLHDNKKEILKRDTRSEDEERKEKSREATPVPLTPHDRNGSTQTLRSINLGVGASGELPQQQHQQTSQRRKSSSGGSHISHRSAHSVRSKRGSTNSKSSSRRDGSEASVQLKTKKQLVMEKLTEQMIRAKNFTIKRTMNLCLPIRQFFYNLVHPEFSAVTDVYVLMFLADTVDFVIIVFGFSAFGKHSAGADITSSLSEDQVPGAFLVMVLIQFGTMVVDRALYLKKTVLGKVIFQVILVFGIHIWMFFILPGLSERRFNENTVAKLWYFVKCIYFGLSAYQIRCGYPTRVLGNFLTKSYNYLNLFLFQGFRLIPFLTELRAVMDWVWTDTSLSLSSWICVEDIYAHIFVLKCWRESERRYPQPRGQAKKPVVKYGMGGMIVMLLICIIWFPLLFMSLVKSVVGVVNKPLDVSFSITLAGFQPIFTMSAQQNHLRNVSHSDFYKTFKNSYQYYPEALQWLESYVPEDLTIAELEGSSNSLWTISPPSRENIIKMLESKDLFPITVSWSIQRNLTLGAKTEFATGKKLYINQVAPWTSSVWTCNYCTTEHFLETNVCEQYRIPSHLPDSKLMNITLMLKRSDNVTGESQEWWIVNQTAPGQINVRSPEKHNEAGLDLYVFSDQVSPPSLGFLAGYGIMGLYASVVLVIGKFVREFFSGISHTIMFEELPNVDRILKLCTDIFLVRETGELDLEEDMYAKLIFLYRSPETMIKWTREKTQ